MNSASKAAFALAEIASLRATDARINAIVPSIPSGNVARTVLEKGRPRSSVSMLFDMRGV